jgi:YD repeat-containing protein
VADVEIFIDPSSGIPASKISALGSTLSFQETTYDAAGRISETGDSYGSVTRYEYDAAGTRNAVMRVAAEVFWPGGIQRSVE